MLVRCVMAFVCLAPAFGADLAALDARFLSAQQLLTAGDYPQARDEFAAIWKEYDRTRGSHHPLTIDARIFYGQTLTMTGRPEQAMNVLGPVSVGEHRQALVAKGSFALALRESGQAAAAVKLLKSVTVLFRANGPDDHVHLGRFESELAVGNAYLGRLAEAERHALASLAHLALSPPEFARHRASVLLTLGQIYLLMNKTESAAQRLAQAVDAAANSWTPRHAEYATLNGALGVLASRRGQWEDAENFTRLAVEGLERTLGPHHAETAKATERLAQILKKRGRKDEAKALAARAREAFRRIAAGPAVVSAWSAGAVK